MFLSRQARGQARMWNSLVSTDGDRAVLWKMCHEVDEVRGAGGSGQRMERWGLHRGCGVTMTQ